MLRTGTFSSQASLFDAISISTKSPRLNGKAIPKFKIAIFLKKKKMHFYNEEMQTLL